MQGAAAAVKSRRKSPGRYGGRQEPGRTRKNRAHPVFPGEEESRGAMGGLPALVGPTTTAGIKGGQAAHGTLSGYPG